MHRHRFPRFCTAIFIDTVPWFEVLTLERQAIAHFKCIHLGCKQGNRFPIKGRFESQRCNLKVGFQSLLRRHLRLLRRLQSIGSHSPSPACPRIERPLRAKCKCYSGERRGPQMKRYSAEGVEDWPSVSVPPTDTQQSSL